MGEEGYLCPPGASLPLPKTREGEVYLISRVWFLTAALKRKMMEELKLYSHLNLSNLSGFKLGAGKDYMTHFCLSWFTMPDRGMKVFSCFTRAIAISDRMLSSSVHQLTGRRGGELRSVSHGYNSRSAVFCSEGKMKRCWIRSYVSRRGNHGLSVFHIESEVRIW